MTRCVDACRLLARILVRAIQGNDSRNSIFLDAAFQGSDRIQALANGAWLDKSLNELRGSGYVVESLEAALWCAWHSSSFSEAVLQAVNLGDDADTTGAVTGQIAGALYGLSAIPDRWLEVLYEAASINALASKLFES